jgi:hypothetical protein
VNSLKGILFQVICHKPQQQVSPEKGKVSMALEQPLPKLTMSELHRDLRMRLAGPTGAPCTGELISSQFPRTLLLLGPTENYWCGQELSGKASWWRRLRLKN